MSPQVKTQVSQFPQFHEFHDNYCTLHLTGELHQTWDIRFTLSLPSASQEAPAPAHYTTLRFVQKTKQIAQNVRKYLPFFNTYFQLIPLQYSLQVNKNIYWDSSISKCYLIIFIFSNI